MTLRFESKGLPSSWTLTMRVAWPPFGAPWSRVLHGYQRNLEQRAADVADRVRRLHQSTTGPATVRPPRRQRLDTAGRHARHVELAGGGRLFVHEFDGPPGAPTLVLLHGWRGTAAGNWATAMRSLARDFHIVAPDLRGHDMEAVDDVIGLVDALGVERFIAVGYSLGSAVAAQLRARHPERVAGLVLCAAAGVTAPPLSASGDISDVPTAVVVTRQDRLIPAWRQLELARSLPGATVHLVDGNHFAFSQFGVFVPVLLEACHSVARRGSETDPAV